MTTAIAKKTVKTIPVKFVEVRNSDGSFWGYQFENGVIWADDCFYGSEKEVEATIIVEQETEISVKDLEASMENAIATWGLRLFPIEALELIKMY